MLIGLLVLAPLVGWALAFERWYILAFLIIVVSSPVFLRWPVVTTFGLYAFLVPFDSVSVLAATGGSTLTRLIGILTAAVWFAEGLVGRRRLVRPPLAALWWGLFVLWAALSAAWALDSGQVFQRLPTTLSLLLLYLVAVSIRPSRRELVAVCALAVLGGTLAAGIAYFATDVSAASARGTLVISGQQANPNGLAAVLILPLALAVGGYVGLRGVLLKAAAMTAIGLIGAGILITASRKAVLAIVGMFLFFLYRLGARWQIVVPVAVLLVSVAVMPQAVTERLETVFTGEDETGSGRTDIWKVGIAVLERHGLFGVGLGNYVAAYHLSSPNMAGPRAAHNTYLGTWVEHGIVGLTLLLVALGNHLLVAYRARTKQPDDGILSSIEAACIGSLIIAFFADMLWSKEFWLLWILLTWATRAAQRTERPGGSIEGDDFIHRPVAVRAQTAQAAHSHEIALNQSTPVNRSAASMSTDVDNPRRKHPC